MLQGNTPETYYNFTEILKFMSETARLAILECLKSVYEIIKYAFTYILQEIHAIEMLFINTNNIYAFVCQLIFFTMCEIVILGESVNNQQGITGLSTLLFYTVFGYFISKINDICENNWNGVRVRYSVTYYIKWVLKIIIEWAKAVAVVLCIKDRGINYQSDIFYTIITFIYYISTEKLFLNLMIKCTSYCNFNSMDSMEHLYVPIIFNICAIFCTALVLILTVQRSNIFYALFASYFIFYLRCKDLYYNYIKTLLTETKTFDSFRLATVTDIENWDDVCAVCLNHMSKARITPCNHLFHPPCLKHCLRRSLLCPLCKRNFAQ